MKIPINTHLSVVARIFGFLIYFLIGLNSLNAQCKTLDETILKVKIGIFYDPESGQFSHYTINTQCSKTFTNYESELLKVEVIKPSHGILTIDLGDSQFVPLLDGDQFELKFRAPFPEERTIRVHYDGQDGFTANSATILKYKRFPENYGTIYTDPDLTLIIKTKQPFNPPVLGYYPPGHKYNTPSYGEAFAHIKLANPDQQRGPDGKFFLCKPIIFVEGLDLYENEHCDRDEHSLRYGSFGWDVFSQGYSRTESFDHLRLMAHQADSLRKSGHDIILLDFEDGADYLQKNANR